MILQPRPDISPLKLTHIPCAVNRTGTDHYLNDSQEKLWRENIFPIICACGKILAPRSVLATLPKGISR